MTHCVVEGCGEEYDVTCSFSFYNVNTTSESDELRQEWVEGALQEDSECLWRHVSLQLCAYHFESDQQGLWIESPVLPELLTVHTEPDLSRKEGAAQAPAPGPTTRDKDSYQGTFESFLSKDVIRLEHNYSAGVPRGGAGAEGASRLNVRHLVDALGYLSLKNLQRKQLWVVNVESGGAEASVTQTEQVIAKMADPKQVIELVPSGGEAAVELGGAEVLEVMEETTIPDNFIYEIAEEQEVCAEDVQEIECVHGGAWAALAEPPRAKYAFIKHCTAGRKRRHFRSPELSFHDNVYILPDADPSVGIEVTTSYEPESFVVDPYQHLVLQEEEEPASRVSRDVEPWETEPARRRRRKQPAASGARRAKPAQDWALPSGAADELERDTKKATNRARRKNKKYVGYDFVT